MDSAVFAYRAITCFIFMRQNILKFSLWLHVQVQKAKQSPSGKEKTHEFGEK